MNAKLQLCPPSAPSKSDYCSGWLDGHAVGQRCANQQYFIIGAFCALVCAIVVVISVTYFWR